MTERDVVIIFAILVGAGALISVAGPFAGATAMGLGVTASGFVVAVYYLLLRKRS